MAGTFNRHRRASRPAGTAPQPPPSPAVLADFDTQLMLQARQGNREAGSALIRRNANRIARYVTRLVGDHRPAEDLTQDVFLQALAHADQYQPTAKVVTWLYRIATNTALNYLKQAHVRRRAHTPPDHSLQVADSSAPAPDRQMSLDELRHQVSQALDGLPVNQRIALTLFQFEECSYEQIAAVLDVSVEAVRSLLMRARTTLRRELRGLV